MSYPSSHRHGPKKRALRVTLSSRQLREAGFSEAALHELQHRVGGGLRQIYDHAIRLAESRINQRGCYVITDQDVREAWLICHPAFGRPRTLWARLGSVIEHVCVGIVCGSAGFFGGLLFECVFAALRG